MIVPNFKIRSQVVPEKSLMEKKVEKRKKYGQIKGLINTMWLFFVTQYNSSQSSFVPNIRILSQVVAEKSAEKSLQSDRKKDKHSYRKGKNYIPLIYTSYNWGYNETVLLSTQNKCLN